MKITTGRIATAQKTVIYGPEGIGKSTLAAKFPNPLFIDTEGSTNNMDVARLDKPTSWSMLLQQIQFVKQNRPCQTLVIDTIDWAERLAISHICATNKVNSIEDFGYGKGYVVTEEEIGRFLDRLQELVDSGINVVLTAHAMIRKFEQPDEMGAYDRYELKLGKKTAARTSSLVREWADMVLFCNYQTISVATDASGNKHKGQGGKRVIYTTHRPAWDAKNRFNLPESFDMGYDEYLKPIFDSLGQAMQAPQPAPQPRPAPMPESIASPVDQGMPADQLPDDFDQSKTDLPVDLPIADEPAPDSLAGVPVGLADLMRANGVTTEDIMTVVAQRGYYPQNTPITAYAPDFIDGVLIAAWDQMLPIIKQNKGDN